MTVIRFAKTEGTICLAPNGETYFANETREMGSLFEEEIKKAFGEGFRKGLDVGCEKAQEELKLLANLLQTVVRKVLEQKERLLDQLKPELIEFSLKVCEKVIRSELMNPGQLGELIHSLIACSGLAKENGIYVYVSPDDLTLLDSYGQGTLAKLKELQGLHIEVDSMMRRGDVRIENRAGLLNYEISRELAYCQVKMLRA